MALCEDQQPKKSIAIIGLAGRFPGARDCNEFWQNLCAGKESISFFSEDELAEEGIDPELISNPAYVRAKGVVANCDSLDARFFKLSPKEAELTDPQHRVFLECAWHALEDAGYAPESENTIGVFAGSNLNTYLIWNLHHTLSAEGSHLPFEVRIGNDKDYLTTRVSYKLGLKGPSVAIQTACSTSLVAVHTACQSILKGECDLALAGAVSITFPLKRGYLYNKEGMFPPDGHCRPFNASSEGCPDSDGTGVIVLKLLETAIADNDHIYAVIKGSAVNNDGSLKVGFTAPSVSRQAAVVRAALDSAEVEPDTITYIEAHGTGTPLGDSIEIEALTEAFRVGTDKIGFCAVGSVKSNIGHLNVASGMAGLIKTLLALQHQVIPATLHFERPNPYINFSSSPFYVAQKFAPWLPAVSHPRRAGISSFGIGGTNAHVILEEYQPTPRSPQTEDKWQLIPLSADRASALEKQAENLAEHLTAHPELSLASVSQTLCLGRRDFNERQIVLGRAKHEVISSLASKDPRWVVAAQTKSSDRPVAFMFPGLGDHYLGMAQELYATQATFRQHFDYCAQILKPVLNVDLRMVLYPEMTTRASNVHQTDASSLKFNPFKAMLKGAETRQNPHKRALDKTPLAHSALFVVEYALSQLLLEWGVRPKAMIGYSIGEYVAACLAGVIKLEDALSLVARRAQLIEGLPAGAMLAITLPANEAERLLPHDVFLSALNGPSLCVVSGETATIASLEQQLENGDVVCRRLSAEYPFHSKLMDPIVARFTEMVGEVELRPPQIPFLSNVTGTWITDELAVDPEYWGRHLSEKVRFVDGVASLVKDRNRILLEVGPGNTLSSIALQHLTATDQDRLVFSSLGHRYDEQGDIPYLFRTLGKLWVNGVSIDWKSFHRQEERCRVSLPGYPFERERYLIEPPRKVPGRDQERPALVKRPDLSNWFYFPSWKISGPVESWRSCSEKSTRSNWLLFVDACGIGAKLAEQLESSNQRVVTVRPGSEWAHEGPSQFVIDPGSPQHLSTLLDYLQDSDFFPQTIVHLWSVSAAASRLSITTVEESQLRGYYSLSLLAQALGSFENEKPVHLAIVSNELHRVTGEENVRPEKATTLGVGKVIPQELPNVTCASIDLEVPEGLHEDKSRITASLLSELNNRTSGVVALRSGRRWLRTVEEFPLPPARGPSYLVRAGGTYLITGGLGAIGLTLAKYLVRTTSRVNLVLTGRTKFPGRESWSKWLGQHGDEDTVSKNIRRLEELEDCGAQLMIVNADVADPAEMELVLQQARNRFGPISGVIHTAGVGGGRLLQLYSQEMTQAILRPKLAGSLVLDSLLAGEELDFFVVCSSISSFIGGLGMADHSAANAFLDSFADWRTKTRSSYTVAINWDSWQSAGLAFEAANSMPLGREPLDSPVTMIDGPLFDRYRVDVPGKFVFSGVLNTSRQWLLEEHRILERALVPGTGYLEMVREAAQHIASPGDLEIRNLVFITPLFVADAVDTLIRLVIEDTGTSFKFTFLSASAAAPVADSEWLAHAEGFFSMLDSEPLPQHNIAVFRAKTDPDRTKAGVLPDSGPLYFGPRWQNLVTVYPGQTQSMALLELPVEFRSDLTAFCLHPALMDIATSFVIQGLGFYMPITYTRLRFRAPLTWQIFSLLVSPEATFVDSDIVTFNITITDTAGRELVAIEDFTMKRIPDAAQRLAGWTSPSRSASERPKDFAPFAMGTVTDAGGNPFHQHLAQGISPVEGAEIFDRVLSRADLAQVLVSTVDFSAWSNVVDAYTTRRFFGDHSEATLKAGGAAGRHRRPNLGIPFVAPRDALEAQLGNCIEELLGLASIGIDDNFFELGGDSLKGIKLVNLIRKKISLDLSLKDLYTLATVRSIAEHKKVKLQEIIK